MRFLQGPSTFDQFHAALQRRLVMQNLKKGGTPECSKLTEHAPYKTVHETIKKELDIKGQRDPDQDPQANTGADTLSEEDLVRLFAFWLRQDNPEAVRDLALCVWMTATLGRSDDARLMYLADLMKPMLIRRLGEWPRLMVLHAWALHQQLHQHYQELNLPGICFTCYQCSP
jgi:hypothetical protein